jgi:hypothetical protein
MEKGQMTPADETAIARAAETRRLAAQQARRRVEAEAELDARRAELPRALSEDRREQWAWWRALAKRVLRRLT